MAEDNGEGDKAPVTQKEQPKEEKENPGKGIMDEILGKDKKGDKPPRKSFL